MLTMVKCSFEDVRNDMGFTGGAYKTVPNGLFRTTEALAKGTEYSTKDDPTLFAGYRRYGASKLCEVMFMCVECNGTRATKSYPWAGVQLHHSHEQ